MTTTFPILDLAIGLIFIYFLFSLVLSSFIEVIMTAFKVRALNLEKWLTTIFDQETSTDKKEGLFKQIANIILKALGKKEISSKKTLGETIMDHYAVKGLTSDGKSPSYIDAKNFAAALIDKVTIDPAKPTDVVSNMGEMINRINASPVLPTELKSVFAGYAMEVKQTITKEKGELELFKNHIENWFDRSMQRLEGSTKRFSQTLGLIASIIIAVAGNVDTIDIANYLYKHPEVSKAMADKATQTIHNTAIQKQVDGLRDIKKKDGATVDTSDAKAIERAIAAYDKLDTSYAIATKTIKDNTIPLGWGMSQISWHDFISFRQADRNAIFLKLLGIMITALAMTLGAPFWFDLLSKVANLRGAGPKPTTSAEKEAKVS